MHPSNRKYPPQKVQRYSREDAIVRSYFHINPLLPDYQSHQDCCFTPDGQMFAVNSDTKMISFFKTDGCVYTDQIANKKYGSSIIKFHHQKNALYLNSFNKLNDHSARLLDIKTSGFIRYFTGHTDHITSIATTQNGIITASLDSMIKLWDDSQTKCVANLKFGHPANVALHPNGNCFAAATESTLYLYDIRNLDAHIISCKIKASSGVRPYFGMMGTKIGLAGPGFTAVHNLTDLKPILEVDLTMQDGIPGFAFTPDEQFILIPTNNYSILVSNFKGHKVTALPGHNSPVTSISFSSAFHNFVSTGKECLFWTVDRKTFEFFTSPY